MNVCTDLRSQTVRGVVLFVLLVSEIVLLVFSFFGVLMWFWTVGWMLAVAIIGFSWDFLEVVVMGAA